MTKKAVSYNDAVSAGSRLPTSVKTEILTYSFTTDVAGATHAASSKTPPVDADELALVDSAASNALKKLTFANLKAWVKSWITKTDVGLANVDNTSDASKLADAAHILVFNGTTYPSRPADTRPAVFLGGNTSANVPPSTNLRTYDLWVPSS